MRSDWDWLRLLGMGSVLVIHAAEPFNPWDSWHIVDPARSRVLGEVALLLAPWVMPLFLYLAGAAAWRSRAARSRGEFVRRRLVRIGVPLVVGTLVLVPPQVFLQRRFEGSFDGTLAQFYPRFFDGIYPAGNFALFHLWFVAFLLVTTLAMLPVIEWMGTPRGREALGRVARGISGPAGFVRLVLAALALRLAAWALLPETRFLMQDWSGRLLLPFAFLLGAAASGDAAFERALVAHRMRAAWIAAVASATLGVVAWGGDLPGDLATSRTARGAMLWLVYTAAAWCWLLALVGFAHARLHAPLRATNARLHRWAGGVYPFYLVHQLAIVALAYVAVSWGAPVAAKFAFVLVGAAAVSSVVAAGRVTASDRPRPRAAARGLHARWPVSR